MACFSSVSKSFEFQFEGTPRSLLLKPFQYPLYFETLVRNYLPKRSVSVKFEPGDGQLEWSQLPEETSGAVTTSNIGVNTLQR